MMMMTTMPPIPELSAEEKKMPLSKYYYTPQLPDPLRLQLVDHGAVDPKDVIPPENFLDLILLKGYHKVEFGWCMMPDGSGYTALYDHTPANDIMGPQMLQWWHNWVNVLPKGSVPGQGNLRYKIWMPYDHYEHAFANGKDGSDGTYSLETLDIGAGSKPIGSVRHRVDPREMGLSDSDLKRLKDAGCGVSMAYETFDGPGHHFVFTFTRPHYLGGQESFTREWIGYMPKDGKLVRDPETPVDDAYLKGVILHNVIERAHLRSFLPQLYNEYKNKPIDAD